MALDLCLVAQMQQTIYVATPTGTPNASGDTTYNTPVASKARVEIDTDIVQTADGNFKETTHLIATEAAIGVKDRVWLPGSDQTDSDQARIPARVQVGIDEDGSVTHYEVRL